MTSFSIPLLFLLSICATLVGVGLCDGAGSGAATSNSGSGSSGNSGSGSSSSSDVKRLSLFHANLIIKQFGNSEDSLNATQLSNFLQMLSDEVDPSTNPWAPPKTSSSSSPSDSLSKPKETADVSELTTCLGSQSEANWWSNCSSSTTSCIKAEELLKLARGSTNRVDVVDAQTIRDLAPTILYQMATGACNEVTHVANHQRKVPLAKSFGYGLLFVAIISLCSLGGAVVLPFMNKRFYKRMLTWMVGLAVGTLAGSGLLHLMPHAYGMDVEKFGSWVFLYKAATIFAGSYLFFCLERILKTLSDKRTEFVKKKRAKLQNITVDVVGGKVSNDNNNGASGIGSSVNGSSDNGSSGNGGVDVKQALPYDSSKTLSMTPIDQMTSSSSSSASSSSSSVSSRKTDGEAHGHSHQELEDGEGIAPVAWMIIFGDGLHNFIDGLSIGAAFTESILAGISISVAVFCEELPHELGDLAILLNSGMKFKQALFYNFLSACASFIGLCFGILLGDVTEFGAKWIFALAAGMFLYLSLTDMIPELNKQASELVEEGTPLWKVLLIQHSGIIIGFSLMLIMAIYGADINFT